MVSSCAVCNKHQKSQQKCHATKKSEKKNNYRSQETKKGFKKSENIHTIENNENVSDNECLKSLQGNVPRLTIEVFSWKGEVIPHQKYPHRQESDDEMETVIKLFVLHLLM
uniref:Uncharacterized protein n=1 Tax=Biomphalaria glabrata TaxID=6526 RepID=A0A2C9L302_BIOGL